MNTSQELEIDVVLTFSSMHTFNPLTVGLFSTQTLIINKNHFCSYCTHTHLQIGINLEPTTRWRWFGCHSNHQSSYKCYLNRIDVYESLFTVQYAFYELQSHQQIVFSIQLCYSTLPEKVRRHLSNRGGAHTASVPHSPTSVYSHLMIYSTLY